MNAIFEKLLNKKSLYYYGEEHIVKAPGNPGGLSRGCKEN
jgi:hypothetical protein